MYQRKNKGVTIRNGYTLTKSKGRYKDMKRAIKTTITVTVKTIATIVFIMICAYLFGSIKVNAAEHAPELLSGSIIDMTQITDFVVNDGSLQLYFNDGTGYYWESDIDSDSGIISDGYMQYYDDNYVDMDTVIGFNVTEYGLMLYLKDGNGYYWER